MCLVLEQQRYWLEWFQYEIVVRGYDLEIIWS
jgi:hypothetical protein